MKKAVLLAAGRASRLQKGEEFRSKAMFEVGGKPLILNAVETINKIPSIDTIIVVYNSNDKEIARVKEYTDKKIEFVVDNVQKGSLYSFWLCKIIGDNAFIMFDCDIIFSEKEFVKNNYEKFSDSKNYVAKIDEVTSEQKNNSILRGSRVLRFCKAGVQEGEHVGYIYKFQRFPYELCKKFIDKNEYRFSNFFDAYVRSEVVETFNVAKLVDIDCEEDVAGNKDYIEDIRG